MRIRARGRPAAAAGLIISAVFSSGTSPLEAQEKAGRRGPGPEAPFRHTTHVPAAWARWDEKNSQFQYGEVDLDCMGCHAVGNPTRVDGGLCAQCHYASFESTGERPGTVEERALFRHVDHATSLVCRHCHGPRGPAGRVDVLDRVPEDMKVLAGTTACLACHGPQAPDLYSRWIAPEKNERVLDAAAEKLTGVLARLNTAPELGPRSFQGPAFFHGDHLRDWPDYAKARGRDARVCGKCHPDVFEAVSACEVLASGKAAARVLGEGLFSLKECGGCHISRAGAAGAILPMDFTIGRRPWRSVTSGTFSHADHLRNRDPKALPELAQKRAEIAGGGCLVCHSADKEEKPGTFRVRQELLPPGEGLSGYDGCAACHTSWRIEARKVSDTLVQLDELDHAAIRADTGRCVKCHRLDHVTDMKAVPYPVKVQRFREPRFVVVEHAHEFITGKAANEGKAADVAKDCSRCHRADLPAQPSRIQKRRFSHASHLPKEASSADCEACHKGIEKTSRPDEIGSERFPLYDEKACAGCHKNVKLDLEAEARREETDVPLFGHADHVGRKMPGGKALACGDCHPSRIPDEQSGVGVLEAALRCTSCHDHKEFASVTGKASDAYVKKCVSCHKTGVPSSGSRLAASERIYIAGIQREQFHPDPAGRPCKDCHSVAIAAPPRIRGEESPELLKGSGWYAGAPPPARFFHKENDASERVFSDGGCFCCHWKNQSESRQRYRWPPEVPPGSTLKELRERVDELYAERLRRRAYPGRACCP